jgi:hypothetical protein
MEIVVVILAAFSLLLIFSGVFGQCLFCSKQGWFRFLSYVRCSNIKLGSYLNAEGSNKIITFVTAVQKVLSLRFCGTCLEEDPYLSPLSVDGTYCSGSGS